MEVKKTILENKSKQSIINVIHTLNAIVSKYKIEDYNDKSITDKVNDLKVCIKINSKNIRFIITDLI